MYSEGCAGSLDRTGPLAYNTNFHQVAMYKECKISLPTSQVQSLETLNAFTTSKVRERSCCLTAELGALASRGVEEAPGLTRGELLTVASRVGNVATTVGDPGNGLAAALVRGLDEVLSAG
jgi:hypothetical protein